MFKARTIDEAADYCKPHIIDYLESRGVKTTPRGGTSNFFCFDTAHHHNGNREPTMQYNPKTNTCYCHQAEKVYDIFNACEILEGKNSSDAFKTILDFCDCRIENGTAPAGSERTTAEKPQPEPQKNDYSDYVKKCCSRLFTEDGRPGLEYLKGRGLSEFTLKGGNVGFDNNYLGRGFPVVVFGHEGGQGYNARRIDIEPGDKTTQRFYKGAHQTPGFFEVPGALTAEEETPLFVVEGEIDALSLLEAGGLDVLALSSKGNKHFEEADIKRPVILALDNDTSGREASEKIRAALDAREIETHVINLYGKHKDANEALLNDLEGLMANIRAAWEDPAALEAKQRAEEYIKTHSAAALIGPFLKHIETAPPAIPTGFLGLDAALDGGIFPGLYVLGAISSLGKTSLCLQIADNIAETGRDVLFFSLEMSRYELMARSISRKTFDPEGERWNAKTARAIMQNEVNYNREERENFERAVREYTTTAQHLFIREGMGTVTAGTVRKAVADHKAATGAAPIIFVDYLQILAPMGERLSDKQATDAAILELKRISRDYSIPVFAISSFNRESYKKTSDNKGEVSMTDFKESGSLEYSADVLIGLQFTTAGTGEYKESNEKKKDPREIRAVILKNRNGKTWGTADLLYYPMFNIFLEDDNNPFTEAQRTQDNSAKRTKAQQEIDNALCFSEGGSLAKIAEILGVSKDKAERKIIEAGGFAIKGDIVTRI